MKIRLLEAELLHAGGRTDGYTDITKLLVVFRNFSNVPKKIEAFLLWYYLTHNFPLKYMQYCEN